MGAHRHVQSGLHAVLSSHSFSQVCVSVFVPHLSLCACTFLLLLSLLPPPPFPSTHNNPPGTEMGMHVTSHTFIDPEALLAEIEQSADLLTHGLTCERGERVLQGVGFPLPAASAGCPSLLTFAPSQLLCSQCLLLTPMLTPPLRTDAAAACAPSLPPTPPPHPTPHSRGSCWQPGDGAPHQPAAARRHARGARVCAGPAEPP